MLNVSYLQKISNDFRQTYALLNTQNAKKHHFLPQKTPQKNAFLPHFSSKSTKKCTFCFKKHIKRWQFDAFWNPNHTAGGTGIISIMPK